jgi:hypothetical protein
LLDLRYLAVILVIGTFMAVTVGHVANYAGSFESAGWQLLGWPYALAVDAAIVICAWLTRWKTTRTWAWIGYFAFVLASGAMNAAAIKPWTEPGIEAVFAWIYALFPTAAIGLLGFLARNAEAVAERSKPRGTLAKLAATFRPAAVRATPRGRPPTAQDRPVPDLDDLDRAIMRTYADHPRASYRTVARTVERPKSTVRDRVRAKLAPAGLIVRTGDQWAVHWSDNNRRDVHDPT